MPEGQQVLSRRRITVGSARAIDVHPLGCDVGFCAQDLDRALFKPASVLAATALGLLAACVLAVTSIPGVSRAFDYDGAMTVADFVRSPHLIDTFGHQSLFNNHPLFSFLEHLVGDVTGSTSETTLRVLPIAFGAAAVGLVSALAARYRGLLPSVVCATALLGNSLFVAEAREVRGYSLMVLCAVASTALLARIVALREAHRWAAEVGYVLAVAAGLATHLYMVGVVVLQIALVVGRREDLRPWAARWSVSVALSGCAYLVIAPAMLEAAQKRSFLPGFPAALVKQLGGGDWKLAVVLLPVAALGVLGFGKAARGAVAVGSLLVLIVPWLLLRSHLYPRFFLWALPGIAWLIGEAVARFRWSAAVLGVTVVACTSSLRPTPNDAYAFRPAAQILRSASKSGFRICLLGNPDPLAAYVRPIAVARTADDVARCDGVMWVAEDADAETLARAHAGFSHGLVLPADLPGVVLYSRDFPGSELPWAGRCDTPIRLRRSPFIPPVRTGAPSASTSPLWRC